MTTSVCSPRSIARRPMWRDIAMPREHGSWSLALEPVALGLLLAPSIAGGWLAAATFAGFLARRPLKLAWREPQPARRRAARQVFCVLAGLALVFAGAAFVAAQGSFAPWLVPSVVLGGGFLWFDLRNAGREEPAEICGAAAFALITGAIVAADNGSRAEVLLADFLMLARALPTVLFVRAMIRGQKTGQVRPGAALATAAVVSAVAAVLAVQARFPLAAAVFIFALLVRAAFFLLARGPRLRARTLGIQELAIGVLYVAVIAATCRTGT